METQGWSATGRRDRRCCGVISYSLFGRRSPFGAHRGLRVKSERIFLNAEIAENAEKAKTPWLSARCYWLRWAADIASSHNGAGNLRSKAGSQRSASGPEGPTPRREDRSVIGYSLSEDLAAWICDPNGQFLDTEFTERHTESTEQCSQSRRTP